MERNTGNQWEIYPEIAANQVISGQFDWDRFPFRIYATGLLTLPSQGDTVMAEVITFPTDFFTDTPTITVSSGINSPQNVHTSYAYVSKDSVEIHWYRTTGAATHQVSLTAVQIL